MLHGETSFADLGPALFSSTGFFSGLGLSAYVQKAAGQLSEIMNGTWYSTQAAGECTEPGDVLGKDCWWRVIEQTRAVNATCVNDNMIAAIVAQRKGACFDDCASPTDESSDCWIRCFFETIVGNTSATPPLPATSKALIIGAFEASFASDDAAKGGCPDVPPCGDPCLPPCWGVPKGTPCAPI